MPDDRLKKYLDDNQVEYITISHSRAFTAQKIAAKAHVPGKELAKSVIIMMDGKMVMAVLPASYRIDFQQLKIALGAKKINLAQEFEFKNKFPDCEVGAMPPFGNLYGIDVYVAKSLAEDEVIAFNACTHSLLIKMKYKDFDRLVKPKILKFTVK
ncbi:MAG: YbaK/EbsC family protein [Bacteroidales bacterium]|jgi:Ala-tRNA(Pro) deacylase|nr:YbaK/EbsC family protein [Bacteroidales bacterium]